MILTNCAACAAPLAHNAPRCVRCHTRYCDSTCQGSLQGQVRHLGSSWPGAAERPPIRYEDSRGDLGGPLDTQLLIYSYIKR
jgi:hypothetical protein